MKQIKLQLIDLKEVEMYLLSEKEFRIIFKQFTDFKATERQLNKLNKENNTSAKLEFQ